MTAGTLRGSSSVGVEVAHGAGGGMVNRPGGDDEEDQLPRVPSRADLVQLRASVPG